LKYLLYLDVALAALGLAMSLSMGYVALVYALYLHASPKIGEGVPSVMAITACFLVLTIVAGAAAFGVWRSRTWRWPVQGALFVLLPMLFFVVRAHLQP
jgi:hypothetical protein